MKRLAGLVWFTFVLQVLLVFSYPAGLLLPYVRKLRCMARSSSKAGPHRIRVLFLENQPAVHAGAHFRVELVRKYLDKSAFAVRVHYPFSERDFQRLADTELRFWLMANMLVKKAHAIFASCFYDVVVVRRELLHQCEYGGLRFEKVLLAIHPACILDMDDYMPFLRMPTESIGVFARVNRYLPGKAEAVLGLYSRYTLASDAFGKKLLESVSDPSRISYHVFPMCVDYSLRKVYSDGAAPRKVGWISQSSHFPRIDRIVPHLNTAYRKVPFTLLVIADAPYQHTALEVPVVNFRWKRADELEQLLEIDIGIAPVFVNPVEIQAKGTFKLVQYMYLGIVALATDLPYTHTLIEDGVNGFLVEDEAWGAALLQALEIPGHKLQQMGDAARKTAVEKHGIEMHVEGLGMYYRGCVR
jgi:glycosyltransferase involved in cell wall biosynthesis